MTGPDIRSFYTDLLALELPWTVGQVLVDERTERVDVHLDWADGALFPCRQCGQECPAGDHSPAKTWRHLDTCGKPTYLHAWLPVLDCPEHGKESARPPWGASDSPVTRAFEQFIARAAEGIGDIKRAALFLRVEPAHIRHILQRTSERVENADARAADRPGSRGEAPKPARARQLGLFDQNDMSFMNRGLQAFRQLELEKAIELFEKHRSFYPKGRDVTAMLAAAELLLDGMRKAPADAAERPAYLCRLWSSLEELVKPEQTGRSNHAAQLKGAFFSRIVKEMEQDGLEQPADSPFFAGGVPKGYVLLQAGRYEEAIRSLQAGIAVMPDNAALYGYLGEAYRLRGDARVARQCYREACLIEPAAVDWTQMNDQELKELHQEVLFIYGLDPALAVAWLPSHARIAGLFEHKAVRLHDGLKELVNDYLATEKAFAKGKNPLLAARLFFRGVILCENAESLKYVKKIDLVQVRRRMQQANPDLFEEFLQVIVDGRGSS